MSEPVRSASVLGLLLSLPLAACTPASPELAATPPPPPAPRADYDAPIGPEPHVSFASATGAIGKRDTLSTALARADIGARSVDEIVAALKGVFDFRSARIGHSFEVRTDEGGHVEWFRYVAGPATIALAFRGSDGALHGLAEPVNLTVTSTLVAGRVSYSLYEAMDAAGETPALTLAFVDLFAWDVDFYTETREGDEFRILVEKRFVDGKLIGYGRVLGAEYAMASGKTHRAFFYQHPDASIGYYTETGASVRKAFLKSPIQFTSITSRYGSRLHPILNYVSTHRGVDYAAPIGTSVWAVGDGVVKSAGPVNGYGNMVAVQHANGLMTRYAHLRGFGAGVSAGKRVQQKQVIGYVGMTGLTTGPHLHFEVLRGGKWMNPLSVVVPPAPPIAEEEREAFLAAIAPFVKRIESRALISDASTARRSP